MPLVDNLQPNTVSVSVDVHTDHEDQPVSMSNSAQIITGQNPFDQQPDIVVIVNSRTLGTTLVGGTDFGTVSAFEFLPIPFLAIALLMMAMRIMRMTSNVTIRTSVASRPVVPTTVSVTVPLTQAAAQTTPCVPTNCPEGYIISNDLTASTNCYFFSGDDKESWSSALVSIFYVISD
ncbi:unnamed protein product [Mytilus coruscus]|uniref:Uncharacterized protein n=1 Tax=Mytilus coruscus TaxID=42192 RepID=A0A6J8A0V6_MYTCO|nr:unnamed protein product [Mytilus coruscus]